MTFLNSWSFHIFSHSFPFLTARRMQLEVLSVPDVQISASLFYLMKLCLAVLYSRCHNFPINTFAVEIEQYIKLLRTANGMIPMQNIQLA